MTTSSAELSRAELEARILVVDDEPEMAFLVADSLREADPSWHVESETDPRRALERLGEEPFDCLVTDLVMPEIGGLKLAEEARSADDEIALIAISGRGTLDSSVEALRMGFADFIKKPFDPEEVQRAVCRTLRRRRQDQTMRMRAAQFAQEKAKMEAARAQLTQKLEIASHDLVRANKRMARQMDDLAMTADVARSLMGVIELENLLGLCAELIGDQVPCETSAVALYEAEEGAVGLMVRARPASDEPPALCWLRTPIRSGVMCRAAQTRKSVHVEEIADSVLMDPQEKDLWPRGRMLVVPVPYRGYAVGTAVLHRPPNGPDFEAAEIKRVSALADVMAPAILTAKVYHRQRCEIYASLEAIADAAADRFPYLKGHAGRVLAYAQPIGAGLGLTQAETGALQIAARLHDIGRLTIPCEAVNHPGPLSEEDWEIVRQHPAAGAEFLAPLEFLGEVRDVIRAHHESYDGTGYPDRKAGEEIPLVARVIAVADAFDAMTSPRPHRDAISIEAALEQVRQLAGQQFDPHVAEAFLRIPFELLQEIQESRR